MTRVRALLAATLLGVAAPALVRAQNPFAADLSIEKEKEMTAQIHQQVRSQVKLVSDPVLVAYVQETGDQLVKATEPQPFIFRFFLIDDPALNAFTIGGGYIYVTTGVLAQAGDANEFAGVLAHEIGHVEKRHIARRSEGQGVTTLATLASLAAVIAGADPGLLVATQGLNVSLQLKHSRVFEEEADREGIGIMMKTGYDPAGMTHFFQRILAENPSAGAGIPAYLFSHPAVKERIAATKVEIARTSGAKSTAPSAKPSAPATDTTRDGATQAGGVALPTPTSALAATTSVTEARNLRLAQMQARLAQVVENGSSVKGLQARAAFDAAKTDPLIAKAQAARVEGMDLRADEILAEAQALEPGDPRVALARADLATERGDLPAAREQLERALALDPNVPLVQYQLGTVCAQLGDRSRAAFYLEQAVTNFRPNTGARRRAEFQLARLEFPMLEASGLATEDGSPAPASFRRGQSVVWWGKVSDRFYPMNPEFRVRWRSPRGEPFFQESLRMSPGGQVGSQLRTGEAPPGKWKVEITVEDSLIETLEFELSEGS